MVRMLGKAASVRSFTTSSTIGTNMSSSSRSHSSSNSSCDWENPSQPLEVPHDDEDDYELSQPFDSAEAKEAAEEAEMPNFDLESLAESFQEKLRKKNLVQDRTDRLNPLKTLPKSFLGSDAITVLLSVMQKQQAKLRSKAKKNDKGKKLQLTREHAVQIGREIVKQFHFITHATDASMELQDDDTQVYQFHHNLPSQVRQMKQRHPTLWDKLKLLEQTVEVKDRRQMFKVFPNAFVAKEAIDVLMDLGLVKSRPEAVFLMNKMNDRIHCCHHITHDYNDFGDDQLFWQFTPASERVPEPLKKEETTMINTTDTSGSGSNPRSQFRKCKSMVMSRSKSIKMSKSSSSSSSKRDATTKKAASKRNLFTDANNEDDDKSTSTATTTTTTTTTTTAPLNSRAHLLKKAQSIRMVRKTKSLGDETAVRIMMMKQQQPGELSSEQQEQDDDHESDDNSNKKQDKSSEPSSPCSPLSSPVFPAPKSSSSKPRRSNSGSAKMSAAAMNRAEEIRSRLDAFREQRRAQALAAAIPANSSHV